MSLKRNDNVLVTSYNPPIKGRIADMYNVPSAHIQDPILWKKYPDGVPMIEVIIEGSGKLQVFVKDVVVKA